MLSVGRGIAYWMSRGGSINIGRAMSSGKVPRRFFETRVEEKTNYLKGSDVELWDEINFLVFDDFADKPNRKIIHDVQTIGELTGVSLEPVIAQLRVGRTQDIDNRIIIQEVKKIAGDEMQQLQQRLRRPQDSRRKLIEINTILREGVFFSEEAKKEFDLDGNIDHLERT